MTALGVVLFFNTIIPAIKRFTHNLNQKPYDTIQNPAEPIIPGLLSYRKTSMCVPLQVSVYVFLCICKFERARENWKLCGSWKEHPKKLRNDELFEFPYWYEEFQLGFGCISKKCIFQRLKGLY